MLKIEERKGMLRSSKQTAKKSYHQNHQHCYNDSLISVYRITKKKTHTHTYTHSFHCILLESNVLNNYITVKNHHLKEEIEATLKIKLSNIMQKRKTQEGKNTENNYIENICQTW